MTMQTTPVLMTDEACANRGLDAVLKTVGYVTAIAAIGTQGLRLATPEPDGCAVREMLNDQAQTTATPFTFLTLKNHLDHRRHGVASSADGDVTQRFDLPELPARIKAILMTFSPDTSGTPVTQTTDARRLRPFGQETIT